ADKDRSVQLRNDKQRRPRQLLRYSADLRPSWDKRQRRDEPQSCADTWPCDADVNFQPLINFSSADAHPNLDHAVIKRLLRRRRQLTLTLHIYPFSSKFSVSVSVCIYNLDDLSYGWLSIA